MLMFIFHLMTAILLAVILLKPILETDNKLALFSLLGIMLLFTIHCITFRSSCINCSLKNQKCLFEFILFWIFAFIGFLSR